MVPARRRATMCRNEGGNGPQDHTLTTKLPTAKSAYRTTTRRLFQHHAPPTEHTYERGRRRGHLQAQCHGEEWRLPWDRVIVAFSKATSAFLLSTKRHLTNDNSCNTSSFGHADRAISMNPMGLLDEILPSYLTCRTRRLLGITLDSGGWRELKAGLSSSILGDGQFFSRRPSKSTQSSQQTYMRKDADHTRAFYCYCCHGAIGRDHHRSSSRLSYDCITCVIWLQPVRL